MACIGAPTSPRRARVGRVLALILLPSHPAKAKERTRLLGQCRLALVHERGSAFRRDLQQCLPGEATGPNATVFPATHGGERHAECLREGFLREPGTMTPCPNHAAGIAKRHDLLGRGVRVVLPAHENADVSRHASFSRTLLGMRGARPNVTA